MSRPGSKKPKTPPQAAPAAPAYVHPAIAVLREGGCHITQSLDKPAILQLNRSTEHGNFSLFCIHDSDHAHLELYSIYPVKALPPAFFETLRLLNHINGCMPGGGYRMDFEDGEIIFRHCIHLGDEPPGYAVLRQALDLTHFALDSFLSLITEVALGRQTCAAALAHHDKKTGGN
ncbi:hypothetical protein IMCC26134_09505 [Verrucomicrobia bacterium IMCC26134]|jgi:hypothetical protein|nr:hypothetical protein IMCC26134_09505 [Verrucomicrobia bacterium IMCC26134]